MSGLPEADEPLVRIPSLHGLAVRRSSVAALLVALVALIPALPAGASTPSPASTPTTAAVAPSTSERAPDAAADHATSLVDARRVVAADRAAHASAPIADGSGPPSSGPSSAGAPSAGPPAVDAPAGAAGTADATPAASGACQSAWATQSTPTRPGVTLLPNGYGSAYDCVTDRLTFAVTTGTSFAPQELGTWIAFIDTDGSGLFGGVTENCHGAEQLAAAYQDQSGVMVGVLLTVQGTCDDVVSRVVGTATLTDQRVEVTVPAAEVRSATQAGQDLGRAGSFGWAGELSSWTEEQSAQPGSSVPLDGWVSADVPPTGRYVPVAPRRVLDTRPESPVGVFATGPLGPGARLDFAATAFGGPTTGLSAVVLHVTAVGPDTPTYLTLWPAGSARPVASNLNPTPGGLDNNLVTVGVGPGGTVSVFNNAGSTNVVVDLFGYVDATTTVGPVLTGRAPVRLLDTRGPNLTAPGVPAGQPVPVSAAGLVPPGATAAVVNLTATGGDSADWVRAWASGPPPWAVALNVDAGRTLPNLVVVPLDANGGFVLDHGFGRLHLVVDLLGYAAVPTVASPTGAPRLVATSPARILDTRSGLGVAAAGPVGTTPVVVPVAGRGGVPSKATAVLLNVTAVDPTASSFLTVYPTGTTRPNASNLNTVPGGTVANQVLARLGPDGSVTLFNNAGSVHVLFDVAGWIA